ncbi:MAG: hypothetical protein [Circular genetic element sp.]|nr:MAG: hypothetical protein [Circular genetic element sp.]
MIITSLPIQSSIDSTQISCKVNIMRGFSTCISAVRYFVSKITCSWCNFLCRGSAALRRSLLHSMRFMPGHNSPTCFTLNRVPQAYPSLHYACSRLARTFRQSEGLFSPHFPSSCRFTGGDSSKSLGRLVRSLPANRRHRHGRAWLCHRCCICRWLYTSDTKIRYSRLNPGTGSVQNTKVRTFWNLLAAPSATVPGTLSQLCLHTFRSCDSALFSTATALALCRISNSIYAGWLCLRHVIHPVITILRR